MIIYPGETSVCEFIVPYGSDYISKTVVSFYQDGKTILSKSDSSIADNEDGGSIITCTLTQSDTLKLKDYYVCSIQINVLSTNGLRYPSEPIEVRIGQQQYRQVMV